MIVTNLLLIVIQEYIIARLVYSSWYSKSLKKQSKDWIMFLTEY